MNGVNKTLYIPLYGKAYVSKRGIILKDKKAEEIWAAEGFPLKGKAKSKWLAYYMGIRSAVFDGWVKEKLEAFPGAAVIHIGCGMDSRVMRIGDGSHTWFDVDFPDVISERARYYSETDGYKMISADARESDWLDSIPDRGHAVVIMEGVSMYLASDELIRLLSNICARFAGVSLLMDCYSTLAAKLSRYKNPINEVGVTEVYGIDDPSAISVPTLDYVREHAMTPQCYIDELRGMEKFVFSSLYSGGFSRKLYKLYEFRKI